MRDLAPISAQKLLDQMYNAITVYGTISHMGNLHVLQTFLLNLQQKNCYDDKT